MSAGPPSGRLTVSLAAGPGPFRERAIALLATAPLELVDQDADLQLVALSSGRKDDLDPLEATDAARPVVALLEEVLAPREARVLAARVDGIVYVAEARRTLMPALRAVHAGMCVTPRSLARAQRKPPLSVREKQVLAMVVLGLPNAEIARKLFVTESTVKSHLSSAFAKLGVKSRNAAAELILDRETGLGLGILRIAPDEEPATSRD